MGSEKVVGTGKSEETPPVEVLGGAVDVELPIGAIAEEEVVIVVGREKTAGALRSAARGRPETSPVTKSSSPCPNADDELTVLVVEFDGAPPEGNERKAEGARRGVVGRSAEERGLAVGVEPLPTPVATWASTIVVVEEEEEELSIIEIGGMVPDDGTL